MTTTSTRLYVFLIYAVILTVIKGNHLYGGTLTYKILEKSESIWIYVTQTYLYNYSEVYCDDTMIHEQSPSLFHNDSSDILNCSEHCNQAGEFQSTPINSICTDYSKLLDITVGQLSDTIRMPNGLSFLIVLKSGSWRRLSLPMNLTGSISWTVSSEIILRKRSNDKYNSPPVATLISPIYIPEESPQVIYISTIDVDGDEVRCRFARAADGCGDVCDSVSLPTGTQLLPNCTLLITGENVDDLYGVTIMVEDFLDSTSNNSLSSIPIQFLINVKNQSSCPPPRLSSPIAESGQCVGVLADEPYTIQLIVENFCPNTTTIEDIATLSFLNVIKESLVQNTTSIWSMVLIWTPEMGQIESQILCAVAIDSDNFQSNQYCITFIVAEENIPLCPGIIPTTQFTTIDSTLISTTIDTTLNPLLTSWDDDQTVVDTTHPSIVDLQSTTTILSESTLQAIDGTTNNLAQLFDTSIPMKSTTIPKNKPLATTLENKFTTATLDDQSPETVLPLATLIYSFNPPQISSTSRPNSNYTYTVVVSSPSDSPSIWRWAAPVIAVLGACLISLCVWCYCCYPSWCCCCKHHQKGSPTKNIPQRDKTIRPPNKSVRVEEVMENEQNLNTNNVHKSPSWKYKHYNTSKITPMPASPLLNNIQHHTPTSLTESYIFGNQHASTLNK